MGKQSPISYRWDGAGMVPLPHHKDRCDERFVIGAIYRLEEHEEISMASRGHYFATLHETWLNLPEEIARHFPDMESLRKFALVMTGYRNQRIYPMSTLIDAKHMAAAVGKSEPLAVITIDDCTVIVWSAETQANSMGKKRFQASKDAVLTYVADLAGIERDVLEYHAGRHA